MTGVAAREREHQQKCQTQRHMIRPSVVAAFLIGFSDIFGNMAALRIPNSSYTVVEFTTTDVSTRSKMTIGHRNAIPRGRVSRGHVVSAH